MDAILSPAESHAFQSFLSAMDYQDISTPEWLGGSRISNDDFIPPAQGSDALTKATKDLMALDSGRWDNHSQSPYGHHTQQPSFYQHAYPHRNPASYQRHETFPFLNNRTQVQPPILSLTPQNGIHNTFLSSTSNSTPTSPDTTPATTPHSPFDLSTLQQIQLNQSLRHRPPSPDTKRPSPTISSSGSSKRLRPSPPASTPTTASSSKQTLLSPSQKKANHIQSEQKRRANIRRGYEALCETVPALREAIREEEEAEARMSMNSSKSSRSKRKKKDTGDNGERDKDGRAGPRSENVVLSKTIDYVNELLSDRSALLARLHRARSVLPSGHPALMPACTGEPLWEREWKGGEGKLDGEGGEEDDENDNDGADST